MTPTVCRNVGAAFLLAFALLAGAARPSAADRSVPRLSKIDPKSETPSRLRRLEAATGFPCFIDRSPLASRPQPFDLKTIEARIRAARGKPTIEDGASLHGHGLASLAASRFAASDVDTLRVAMIRVDFLHDRSGDSTTTIDGRFDLRHDQGEAVDPAPHDRAYFQAHGRALANFYRAQSFGHLEVAVEVFPTESDSAFHLTDTADYGPWSTLADNPDVADDAERLIKDALHQAELSGQVDFSRFDAFIVVHAGADFQSDVNRDSQNDIPTFVLALSDTLDIQGKKIAKAMVLPETTTQDGFTGALNGNLAHEFGHILGLPDLYNVRTGFPMVGWFSLMDSGNNIGAILVNPDSTEVDVFGAVPTSFDAWCRIQLFLSSDAPGGGFLASRISVVEDSLRMELGDVLTDSRIILCPIHDTEYYLVENRATELDGNGFPIIRADPKTGVILGPVADSTLADTTGALEYDALLPSGGLLVWQIDNRVLYGDLMDPFGVNTNINRRGIKLIEADGIEDQGRRNYGTPWDPFYAGNNGYFGSDTVPRSTSNDGQFSRVEMRTDSPPGRTMNVAMRRGTGLTGWPIPLLPNLNVTSTTLADVSGDGSAEMLFTLGLNVIAVEGKNGQPYPPSSEPGSAVPWARATSTLDRRLVAGKVTGGSPSASDRPIVAAWASGGGEIAAWNVAGERLPVYLDEHLTGASTPPFLSTVDTYDPSGTTIGWGTIGGAVRLAHFMRENNTYQIFPDRQTEPAMIGDQPDPVTSNILFGSFGQSGGGRIAWAGESGYIYYSGYATLPGAAYSTPGAVYPIVARTGASLGNAQNFTLIGANFRGPARVAYDVAVVDRAGRATLLDETASVIPGWPVDFPAPLIGSAGAGDVDGDGGAELVAADTLGNIVVVNGDGTNALHFPLRLGAKATTGPMLVQLDDAAGFEIVVMTEDGSLHAITREGKEAHGFPIALGGQWLASSYLDDLNGDGTLDVVGGSVNHLLNGFSLDTVVPDSLIAWRGEGNGPSRSAMIDGRVVHAAVSASNESAPEDLVCFPNPARGGTMNIRVRVQNGDDARASVYDLNGRPIAEGLRPTGNGVEANIVWDLAGVAPGVYLVRVEVNGPGAPGSRVRMVSVLK